MASDQNIILFDLASRDDNKCWSLNPWKTRFLLNFKGLDYTTQFLEYPDLKKVLSPHITADLYTSPTIKYPDGQYIMDSRVIADFIEKKHPEPPVYLDSPYLKKVEDIMPKVQAAVRGHWMANIPRNVLNEASNVYWIPTREERLGMTLDELEKTEGQDWEKAKPLLHQVTGWLKENNDGPFFLGKTVSYADFQWGGFLVFIRRSDQNKFQELLQATGDPSVHLGLVEALEPWSKRDNY